MKLANIPQWGYIFVEKCNHHSSRAGGKEQSPATHQIILSTFLLPRHYKAQKPYSKNRAHH
jgi:hypothetical protein